MALMVAIVCSTIHDVVVYLYTIQTYPFNRTITHFYLIRGLDNVDLDDEESRLFQLLIAVSSSMWRRMVSPYCMLPYTLAPLLDWTRPLPLRVELLEQFMALCECCLDDGVGKPLWKLANSELTALDAIRGDSLFMQSLLQVFMTKVTNITLENNFARASSSRQYLRGRHHVIGTMTNKHVAAEMKHQHSQCLARAASEVAALTPASKVEPVAAKKVNSWILFMKKRKANIAPLVGESECKRYKRVQQQAMYDFKDPCFQDEIASLRADAKRQNKEYSSEVLVSSGQPQPAPTSLLQALQGNTSSDSVTSVDVLGDGFSVPTNTVFPRLAFAS